MRLGKHQQQILQQLHAIEMRNYGGKSFTFQGVTKVIQMEKTGMSRGEIRSAVFGPPTPTRSASFSRALKGLVLHGLVEIEVREKAYMVDLIYITEAGCEEFLKRSDCKK